MPEFFDTYISDDCINVDSLCNICLKCNACGRLDASTKKQCELEMYKNNLKYYQEFKYGIPGKEELQKKNVANSIRYYKEKIRKLESMLVKN